MNQIIRRMLGKRVLVIGDIMLDKYIWGNVTRISPEAPVQIVDVQDENYTVGGAGNTAANIASLGGEPVIIGVAGNDDSWRQLQEEMKKKKISTNGIIVDGSRKTTRKVRVMGGKQQLIRIDHENREKISEGIEEEVIRKIGEIVDDVEVILISDYNKGLITQKVIDFVAEISRRRNIKLIVDPKPSNRVVYNDTFIITPNHKEACEIVGYDSEDNAKLGKLLHSKMGCNVLITLGEKGMMLFEGNEVTNIATRAKEVYDVSGAGDTVVATLGLAIAAGSSLKEAAMLANHAAGVVVGKVGTSCITAEELEASLNE
ncbi:MAG TPA: D-glycero-beta-D-manno-heptose-7-phosphate kinase [Candidatus Nanoarchaeia archaeon]|nr:D-glycero-beta-D-manno-heptose-7-phosphate kinase [Candidatus Nanoarchaeia archaeon]